MRRRLLRRTNVQVASEPTILWLEWSCQVASRRPTSQNTEIHLRIVIFGWFIYMILPNIMQFSRRALDKCVLIIRYLHFNFFVIKQIFNNFFWVIISLNILKKNYLSINFKIIRPVAGSWFFIIIWILRITTDPNFNSAQQLLRFSSCKDTWPADKQTSKFYF